MLEDVPGLGTGTLTPGGIAFDGTGTGKFWPSSGSLLALTVGEGALADPKEELPGASVGGRMIPGDDSGIAGEGALVVFPI